MTRRAVVYARVSTEEQADHGYSLSTQIDACRQYAEKHAYMVVAVERDDSSGAKLDREGLERVRGMALRREIDAVIVYTSDRLTRNLAHSLILREEWRQLEVELHYVNRGRLEDTAEGRLTENIESVIAEYEREKFRERAMRGRRAKAAAGRVVGDGHPHYGYGRIGKGRTMQLVIIEEQAAVVRRIFELYCSMPPVSLMYIVELLTRERVPPPDPARSKTGAWYPKTVRHILRARCYIGEFTSHGQKIVIPELRIVDDVMWKRVQARIEENKKHSRRNRKYDYLLVGRFRCVCGGRMSSTPNKKPNGTIYLQYRCAEQRWKPHLTQCREGILRVDVADTRVWNWLCDVLTDDVEFEEGFQQLIANREAELAPKRARLRLVEELIERTERKVKRLVSTFADGDDMDDLTRDAVKAEIKMAGRQREALVVEQEALTTELVEREIAPEAQQAIRELIESVRTRLDNATYEQKRAVLAILDVQVELQRTGAERWLYVTCGLSADSALLDIEGPGSIGPCAHAN